jgi:hypothetical protein
MPILTNALGFKDSTTLTIASGVVTVTQTMHIIAAESATSDDLDTINISADLPTVVGSDNFRTYILLRADSGDTITVKHSTGNITLGSGQDYVLSGSKTLQLLYTGSAWVDLQSSAAAAGFGGSTGSTDNAILRADGTGGATVQASGVTIDDSDNVSNVTNLTLDSIQFTAATELTIASGAVTITQSVHTIDTEGDAATDDLVTINGSASERIIYLRAANDARTVVLKHGTGNIQLYGEADVSLDEDHKTVQLLYNGTNWLQVGGSGGGGSITVKEADGTPTVSNVTTIVVSNGTLTNDGSGQVTITTGGSGSTSRELFISAASLFPSTTNGCAAPARNEYATNDVDLYSADFDQTSIEYAQFTYWMPANWNASTVTFAVAWTASAGTAAQTVEWNLEARAYANDDAIDQAWGTAVEVSDALLATNDMHYTSTSSAVTIAGTPSAGELVQFRVWRDATNDTLAADAKLLGIKVNYTIA